MEGLSQFDLKQEAGNREKIYFGIILLLILVAFARWFYIPKLKDIKMVQIEIKNGRMQVDTLRQFAQLKLPEVKATAQPLAVRGGTRFEQAVEASLKSQQQVVADIVKMLTSANMLEGVSLAGMNFGSEVNKGPYSAIPVDINLEGKYSGILSYLEHVEKFGKLVTADNIELNVKKEDPSLVSAKVSANIYVVHQLSGSSEPMGGPGATQNAARPPAQAAGK